MHSSISRPTALSSVLTQLVNRVMFKCKCDGTLGWCVDRFDDTRLACDCIQEEMRLRHHHEADVLCAVQRLDWEWKMREIGSSSSQPSVPMTSSSSTSSPSSDMIDAVGCTPPNATSSIEIHVPLVAVDDDLTFQPV